MARSIDDDILDFSSDRPLWMQDLFRRVFTQLECTPEDLYETLKLLKSAYGLLPPRTPQPLTPDHMRFREGTVQRVALLSLSDTRNVNRLIPDQTLPFARSGITLIYGDNGSGKSGYCRILRQLCRARREKPETVLGDVFSLKPPPPAQAKLVYTADERVIEHIWTDGSIPPRELSRLTLFDANAAPIYVDKHNQIEFLPQGLDILPRMGSAIQSIAALLDKEIEPLSVTLQNPVVTISKNTAAGLLVERLRSTSTTQLPTTEEIEKVCQWTEDDQNALQADRQNLAALAEPAKAAAKSRRMKATLQDLLGTIRHASDLLDDPGLSALRLLYEEAHSARQAASVAASKSFQNDPFGAQIGGRAWMSMFQYAREFSEVVYPGERFPATGTDKFCILCQQPLSAAASDRLERFHTFVSAAAARDAEKKERELASKLQLIKEAAIPSNEQIRVSLGEYLASELKAEEIARTAGDHCRALFLRQSEISAERIPADVNLLPVLYTSIFDSLSSEIQRLEAIAQEHEKAAQQSAPQTELATRIAESEARRVLQPELDRLIERRNLLSDLSNLKKCRAACDTSAISRKASALRDEHLTSGFQSRLNLEVQNLAIDYLPIKVEGKSERGASYVGVLLDQPARARTSAVLSEGEFRVLALACFLAEVSGIEGHNGIIVDDPVSSLDHRHIRQVARRLVVEAQARPQVIIFTHNLPFYYEILEAAREAQVPVTAHWARREGKNGCGKIDANDAPWQVKNVKKRLVVLEAILSGLTRSEHNLDCDIDSETRRFYTALRETWERLVEEKVLGGVVGRFEPGVKTQSLKNVVVDDEDYRKVYVAMTKASRYSGHDMALSFQTSLPTVQEMRADLEALRTYEKELTTRSKEVSERRKDLEDPITAAST